MRQIKKHDKHKTLMSHVPQAQMLEIISESTRLEVEFFQNKQHFKIRTKFL